VSSPAATASATGDGSQDPPARTAGPREALRTLLLGPRAAHPVWGWLASLVVTAIAGMLRFWHLDRPHQLVFDETYYVKHAASLLQFGYERRWNPNATPSADQLFTRGTTDVFTGSPDFVVHPPLGKWMIAAGMQLFGGPASSWGWRFSAALVGTLMVLMTARIARRLFCSTLLGVTAGLLLAVDGQHYVLSRTALLDIFLAFWVLAAFGCLLIDRDRTRARLALAVGSGADVGRFGPGLGFRWWRVAAGLCLGLACGTKWSGLYFLAVFGLMTVCWDLGARRAAGVWRWISGTALRDGVPAALQVLPIALAAYLASWTGWFLSRGAYHRQWGAQHPSESWGWIPDPVRGLWKYHQGAYSFHVGLSTPHRYEANPWSWLVLGRPTAFFYESLQRGQQGCAVTECSKMITPLGNPVIWWGATLAVLLLLVRWALRRDWRAGAVLAGLVAGYLPWFHYQQRTIFSFYSVAFSPWVAMALTYGLGWVLGRSTAGSDRRLWGAVLAGGVVVLAVLTFTFFFPIHTAQVIPRAEWLRRMWLRSWI
jgi:dolichyl-phosphate-mannose-protein mannosyltransferase